MMWGTGSSAAWLWLGIALLALAGVTALASVLARSRRPGRAQGGPAARELDERFARGQIGQDDYTRRRAIVDATPPGRWHWNTALVITLAAIAGVGAASVALAATAVSTGARPAAAAGCPARWSA